MATNLFTEQLRNLPGRPDVTWQGGALTLPTLVRGEDGGEYAPSLFLWVDTATGMVRPAIPDGPELTVPFVLQSLVDFAKGGDRPGRIEVRDARFAEAISEVVKPLGIVVALLDKLPAVDAMAAELLGSMPGLDGGSAPESLADDPAITPDRLGRFAAAAAGFHAAAPWEHFGPTDLVRVVSPKVPKPLRFFNVMGGGGEQFGLAFFPSEKSFEQMVGGDPGAYAERHAMVSVTFDTAQMIPPGDVAIWKQHDWPTGKRGRKPVYPFPVTFNRGVWIRPTVAELSVMEGLLRAVGAVDEASVIAGRWKATVPTAEGPVEYAFELTAPVEPPFAGMNPMDPFGGLAEGPTSEADRLLQQSLATSGARAIALAKRAIAADPDLVDAYNRLGDLAPTPAAAIPFYEQGNAIGERVLGPKFFKWNTGHFWGILETRPYMRALAGLSRAQKRSGQVGEAIRTWQRMLDLNPGDNQGMRDILLAVLMEEGRDADAAALIASYPDDAGVVFLYSDALLAFRKEGDSATAMAKLRRAFEGNPQIIPYLAGVRPVPGDIPEMYEPGKLSEAETFAGDLVPSWRATAGTADWLKKYVDLRPPASAKRAKAKTAKRSSAKKKK